MKVATAEFLLSAHHCKQFLRDGIPEVAFAGRSNVGKSSLMNRLLNRKGLARTGSTPGRTQAVNYFLINGNLYFVDLPGYGFAKAPRTERRRWAELMNDYFGRPEAPQTLLLQLVDGKVGATRLDVEALAYFQSLGLEPLIVATKIDKLPRTRRPRSLTSIRERLGCAGGEMIVPFSAVTGEGVQQLWGGISDFLERRRRPAASKSLNQVGMK
ncbi:MAG: ribosome biogenesis GTP-binding protein YihA/YsxC [Thermoanaerobaculia bacterium]